MSGFVKNVKPQLGTVPAHLLIFRQVSASLWGSKRIGAKSSAALSAMRSLWNYNPN